MVADAGLIGASTDVVDALNIVSQILKIDGT